MDIHEFLIEKGLQNEKELQCLMNDDMSETQLTLLHKLVMKTKSFPVLYPFLHDHMKKSSLDYINQKNEKGCTALYMACKNINIYSTYHTIKMLLEHNADPNICNEYGNNALRCSCSLLTYENVSIKTIKLLLKYNAKDDIYSKVPLLHDLCCSPFTLKRFSIIQLLIQSGLDVNVLCGQDKDCNLIMTMFAIGDVDHKCKYKKEKDELVYYLMDHGMNMDYITANNKTPLYVYILYVNNIHIRMIKQLISEKTILIENPSSFSHLSLHIKNPEIIDMIRLFLSYKINIFQKYNNFYALDYFINKTKKISNITMKTLQPSIYLWKQMIQKDESHMHYWYEFIHLL